MPMPGNNQHLWLLIGAASCQRVAHFRSCLRQQGKSSLFVAYGEVLNRPDELIDKLIGLAPTRIYVKLETPGTDPGLNALLVNAGYLCTSQASPNARQIENTLAEKGRLIYLYQWYKGFEYLLTRVKSLFERLRQESPCRVSYLNHPDNIALMFNKPASLDRLRGAGIRTPGASKEIAGYQDLKDFMRHKGWRRVFIKPSYGASAAGVIAYQYQPSSNKSIAVTAIETVKRHGETHFYNNLRLRKYTNEKAITEIVDYIAANHAYAEPWIPKSQYGGKNFDVRAIVVSGKMVQLIARLSHTPITNLHLGNDRKSLDDIGLCDEHKDLYSTIAEQAMAVFPGAVYAGLDILIPHGGNSARVIELNAFGDYIKSSSQAGPGAMISNAIYAAQIAALSDEHCRHL